MKFNIPEDNSPKPNGQRVRTKFAWLPKVINNKLVWLERYKALESYSIHSQTTGVDSFGMIRGKISNYHYYDWKPIKLSFIDQDPLELYKKEEAIRIKKMNLEGRYTLKQFLDNPDVLLKTEQKQGDK